MMSPMDHGCTTRVSLTDPIDMSAGCTGAVHGAFLAFFATPTILRWKTMIAGAEGGGHSDLQPANGALPPDPLVLARLSFDGNPSDRFCC